MKTIKKTRKHRNKTRKHKEYNLKILPKKYKLYASKKYDGDAILKHAHSLEQQYHKRCITENLTWLGTLDVARNYKTDDTKIYKWETINKTRLITFDKKNESYFKQLFLTSKKKITPFIKINNNNREKILKKAKENEYNHIYLNMNYKQASWYEFAFAYGYLTFKEQYEFLLLIKFLLDNNFVEINMRNGKSIISKIDRDILYYRTVMGLGNENENNNNNKLTSFSESMQKYEISLFNIPISIKEKYNRISFYIFDQSALTNLCILLPDNIDGVYQSDSKSMWFPDLLLYRMNIEEYVLFNPYHNLKYINSVI
jgi:hypothetical protein